MAQGRGAQSRRHICMKIVKGAIPVSSKLDMRLMDSMTATCAWESASVRASSLPTNRMSTMQSQAREEAGSGPGGRDQKSWRACTWSSDGWTT
ncbi:hypothetical protein IG631_03005 [Alternaria alternata]|nr:hypothetical protein IG631_03005 [Alternaria alternata]